MSLRAISYVMSRSYGRSADKLVMLCLANCADDDGTCYPSQARIARESELDRKTVIASMKRLRENAQIISTGEWANGSSKVPVLRIALDGEVPQNGKNGTCPEIPHVPKLDITYPKNGQSPVPILDSLVSRKRDTDTSLEPSLEPSGTVSVERARRPRRRMPPTLAPDHLPLSDGSLRVAQEMGTTDPADEVAAFLTKARAKGWEYADWQAAFQNWCRIGKRRGYNQPAQSQRKTVVGFDPLAAAREFESGLNGTMPSAGPTIDGRLI